MATIGEIVVTTAGEPVVGPNVSGHSFWLVCTQGTVYVGDVQVEGSELFPLPEGAHPLLVLPVNGNLKSFSFDAAGDGDKCVYMLAEKV